MAFHELREKYRRLSSPEQAEAAWTSIFDHTRDHCTHFHGCKARPPLPAAILHACLPLTVLLTPPCLIHACCMCQVRGCRNGSRMQQLFLVSGAVVPVWAALEKTVSQFQ